MSKSSRKLQNYGIQGVSYYISIIYVCHLAQVNVGELDPSCTVDVPFSQPVTGHKIYFRPVSNVEFCMHRIQLFQLCSC